MRCPSILHIARCYFSSFYDSGRQFRLSRFIFLGLLPFVLSIAVVVRFASPTLDALGVVIPVYSVLIAVLVGTLPLAHSVIGQTDPDRKYTVSERAYANSEIDRIQALQDVLASISYAVIFLVLALVGCIILAFLAPSTSGWLYNLGRGVDTILFWVRSIAAGIVYFGGISALLGFFDISIVVFHAMEDHAKNLKERIRDSVGQ